MQTDPNLPKRCQHGSMTSSHALTLQLHGITGDFPKIKKIQNTGEIGENIEDTGDHIGDRARPAYPFLQIGPISTEFFYPFVRQIW